MWSQGAKVSPATERFRFRPIDAGASLPGPRPGRAARFLSFSFSYWRGETRGRAWLLTGGALSGGEQQRAAFARILLTPPNVLIMDEPTSALDEASQERMMNFFREKLTRTSVIHVGHRPGLEPFHDREIHPLRQEGGPAIAEEKPPGMSRRLLRYTRERRERRRKLRRA